MQKTTTATYRRVPILRPGEYIDMQGNHVAFSVADLAAIAEHYDPHYSAAVLNIDHAAHGPALGIVADLAWDGTYLCADLANVPTSVATAIDAGRYPFRSAEVYRDLDGRGLYLRAVALLGARPPAVKGLPGWPLREQEAVACASPGPTTTAGADTRPDTAGIQPAAIRQQPFTFHIISEVRMPHETIDTTPDQSGAPEALRLAEENHRLAEENRRLKRAERRREISVFLAELRDGGQLTPAMEQAGLEEALLSVREQSLSVTFPDGKQAPLSAVLGEVLRALPVSYTAGETAMGTAAEPVLSTDERGIASALGLTDREFADIRSSQ